MKRDVTHRAKAGEKISNLPLRFLTNSTMTDRDKQRLDELEVKTAYLLARQDEQDAKMSRIMARLAYVEARQYRLMKELGIEPTTIDTTQTARDDAKTINLTVIPEQRLN